MNDSVTTLISDMKDAGWSVDQALRTLLFTRGETTIIATQETVKLTQGALNEIRIADRMWATIERLSWLLAQVRDFAALTDSGQTAVMERWQKAENAIRKLSWEQALASPTALALIERGIGLLAQVDSNDD